jgi:hypothetical protein
MEKREELLNTIMGCSICGYYTCNKRDFIRHNETKKHKMRVEIEEKGMCIPVKKNDELEVLSHEDLAVTPLNPQKPRKRAATKNPKSRDAEKVGDLKKGIKNGSAKERKLPDEDQVIAFTNPSSSIKETPYLAEDSSDEDIYDTIYSNPRRVFYQWPGVFHAIFAFCGMIMDIFFEPRSSSKSIANA